MMSGTAAYYMSRSMRRVALALPAEILVAFDLRVKHVGFRSRNPMITGAIPHLLVCPDGNWEFDERVALA